MGDEQEHREDERGERHRYRELERHPPLPELGRLQAYHELQEHSQSGTDERDGEPHEHDISRACQVDARIGCEKEEQPDLEHGRDEVHHLAERKHRGDIQPRQDRTRKRTHERREHGHEKDEDRAGDEQAPADACSLR